ncbi:MAG: hypothetical protein LBD06_03315 [Candidatus Accumulibacter sp.]|nr:hypothetical protein [Accumulibacter sp.]
MKSAVCGAVAPGEGGKTERWVCLSSVFYCLSSETVFYRLSSETVFCPIEILPSGKCGNP